MGQLPLATCAQMLGIHPKTLHQWLKEANVPLAWHQSDARIKCIEEHHLREVARLHGRPLPERPAVPEPAVQPLPTHEAEPGPGAALSEPYLIEKVASLEAKVQSLQEQLTQLALALLAEREHPLESRLATLEIITAQLAGRSVSATSLLDPQITALSHQSVSAPPASRAPHPAEKRGRPLLALIEYGASGDYVIICPHEGELSLLPDSGEWFAWLASLCSFRFVGRCGRMSVTRVRDHGPKRTWYAYRTIHQHDYKHYLGTTDHLSIEVLEEMAARLQSYVDAC